MKDNKLETISNLFEGKEIRSIWDSEKEEYYFSVVDVVSALTESNDARKYWSVLKNRLKKEGSELTTFCSQLKMLASDGKMRLRDVLDTKGILRLIESVPSPKAEPFKVWLANLGSERIDEVFDPEIAVNRAVEYYRNKGYSDEWIKARLTGIVDRFKLTDVWKDGGINKPIEYALLTNEIYKEWSGMKVSEYKEFKGIRKESLRDNMSEIEKYVELGLDGVEVWHPSAKEDDVAGLTALCKKKKLLMTGGSDFHGIYGDTTVTLGSYATPKEQLDKLLGYKAKKKRAQRKAEKEAAMQAEKAG